MMLNHGCARLVTEGGLCRKLECTGYEFIVACTESIAIVTDPADHE